MKVGSVYDPAQRHRPTESSDFDHDDRWRRWAMAKESVLGALLDQKGHQSCGALAAGAATADCRCPPSRYFQEAFNWLSVWLLPDGS